jgi:hypothetical protein
MKYFFLNQSVVIPWNISCDMPAIQYNFIDHLTLIIIVAVKTAGKLFNS